MFSKKTRKMWTISVLVFIIMALMTTFISASAEEIDENEAAVIYLTENGEFNPDAENADDYKAAASTFIDNYTDNVSTEASFSENLTKAIKAVRDDIKVYATGWALLPPIIAIVLALITKEVYSSLFIGILSGALLYSNFSFTGTMDHMFAGGFIPSIADSYNIGILLFLVILGAIVVLMNKAGGSAAFGKWAEKHIKSKVGAPNESFSICRISSTFLRFSGVSSHFLASSKLPYCCV